MNQLRCPPKDALREWSSGGLSREAAATISVHLDNCPSCRAHVEEFERHPNQPPSTNSGTPLPRLRDYELLAQIGEGGMGTVYKARHVKLRRLVAVKVLSERRLGDPEALARFHREMEAVGRLDHPHVVRAMDAGEHDGKHYLVMEYVSGIDLAQLVDRLGPLPIADACELARQAALGLQAAHDQQMVHRDIKPSNLILAWPEGSGPPIVKVLDLGLARLAGRLETPGELTHEGHMVGTLDYMAPEQSGDSHEVDIRADLYSLGATLYRLLTGHVPFGGEGLRTPLAKLKAIANDPPLSIRRHRPAVPPALEQLIHRLMAKSPSQRPATPRKLAEALAVFTAHADLQKLVAKVRSGQVETQAIKAEGIATRHTPTPRAQSRPPTPTPAPAPAAVPAEPLKGRTTPPPFRPTVPGTGGQSGGGGLPAISRAAPRTGKANSSTWIFLTAVTAFFGVLVVGGGAIALYRSFRDGPAAASLPTEQIVAQSEASVALIRGRMVRGTGFLAQPNLLVTNKHLLDLELPANLEIHFPSAKEGQRGPFTAELVYEDAKQDLAILRVAAPHKPLPLAAGHQFRRGQEIISIGNNSVDDQALSNAVTKGVMSNETTIDGDSYYQLSMSVSPGNSGWPVLDGQGRVIGLVTYAVSQYDGLACCTPVERWRDALVRAPSLTASEVQRADSLHRAQVVFRCVDAMTQQYQAGMQVYAQQIRQAVAGGQTFADGVAAAQAMLAQPVSPLDAAVHGDLAAEIPRLAADQQLDDAARTALQELWANYLELKVNVDQPSGDESAYAAKYLELTAGHDRLSASLRTLLGLEAAP